MNALPDPQLQPEFYADIPSKRFFAWIIDLVIILALVLLVLVSTFGIALFLLPLVVTVTSFVYRVATISAGSATFGMRMMAIELRNREGQRLSFPEAALHTFLHFVMFGSVVLQIISIATTLTTERAQGLHDLILGTTALNKAARYRV
ncbi:hypothetical protein ACMU_17790 [Actibacterium mucosum KCTC 23349]|uniref:RDD domain-containing protein n=1 Tax=Actibacterium mucosum KCTC 23349 TaxID=1454373 RepID=A0A037ZDK4_9RHOB|nr:RDD family protein [Actibacterium mucosum]KAJ54559.1 hypothetical protein ACMU_17790 [Actibacterium mucosum KCTC 23349]